MVKMPQGIVTHALDRAPRPHKVTHPEPGSSTRGVPPTRSCPAGSGARSALSAEEQAHGTE